MADFTLADHGSICLLTPRTPAAEAWVDAHLPEDAMAFGHGIAVERRYVSAIVDGIERDRLEVEL